MTSLAARRDGGSGPAIRRPGPRPGAKQVATWVAGWAFWALVLIDVSCDRAVDSDSRSSSGPTSQAAAIRKDRGGAAGSMGTPGTSVAADGCYHVRPGMRIQDALEKAAGDPNHKTVKVHPGTYRPQFPGQAMIWLSARHDGITLEAIGDVTLSAANPRVADRSHESFPAVVNHVVYFGDRISRRTVLRGFKIIGANNFVTRSEEPGPIEPSTRYVKKLFFYADGGAIKVFGESYPSLEGLIIQNNYASPCGGGISVEHPPFIGDPREREFSEETSVLISNCVFRKNRARVTGSAVDLLWGSSAIIENCLFVGNVSNTGTDFTVPEGTRTQYDSDHGCGALTVFLGSRARVDRCTFTANYNGVDDMSLGSRYTRTIFWRNNATGGIAPKGRYEVAMRDGGSLEGCFLKGTITDLNANVSQDQNVFDAPDPGFDSNYRPSSIRYRDVGYRAIAE